MNPVLDSADSVELNSHADDAAYESSNEKPALGSTITIEAGDTSTIQDAINNAEDGDTIILNGIFKSNGTSIHVDKNLTFKGGSDGATVDGNRRNNEDLFNIYDDLSVTFENLNFIRCRGEYNNIGSAIHGGSNDNIKISNCHFENNTAAYGGSCIFANHSSTLTIDNCQFVNSNFTMRTTTGFSGGGAIALNGSTCTISNSLFDNCTSLEVGGAIFAHNSILTIQDSEIRNCTAESGAAIYSDKDVSVSNLVSVDNHCDWDLNHNETHVIAPNTIPQESKECVFSVNNYGYTRFDDGYLGYCINEYKIVPKENSWFSVRENNTIINHYTGEDVFEYLKLLVNYYYDHEGEFTRGRIQILFRPFTDGKYLESDNETIQEIIRQYNEGMRIPTHGAVKINDTTSRFYDFRVYDNMDARFQDEMVYRMIEIHPDATIEKVSQEDIVFVGDKVQFVINVTNTGDCDLTEFFIRENMPEGLTYEDYSNGTGNWNLTDDCKWILDGDLAPGESVTLTVIASTTKSGNFTNAVSAGSVEFVDEKTAEDTIEVLTRSLKVEKVSNEKKVSVGDEATFTIRVINNGDCTLENVFVEDIVPDGLTYAGYYNGTRSWTNEDTKFYLEGSLDPGDSATLFVKFIATKEGNFTNCVIAGSDLIENQTSNDTVEVEDIENSTDTNKTDDTDDDDDDNIEEDSNNNGNDIDKKSTTVNAVSKSTGNPLLALFVVLVLLLMTPFRRNKK